MGGRVFIEFLAYSGMKKWVNKAAKKEVKKVIKKRRLNTKCPKCGKRIVGKICYYQRKMLCKKCFREMKYEDGGRRRWVARGPRGRPPINPPVKLF